MDSLTGLHDRHSLLDWGRAYVLHELLLGTSITLMILDLDHFEILLGSQGRQRGDAAIKTAAEAIRGKANDVSYVARTGETKFAIVLPKTSSNEAEPVTQEIFNAVRTAMNAFPPIDPSAGVAWFEQAGLASSFDRMLRRALTLMHSAKLAGSGNIVYKCFPSSEITTAVKWN